MMRRRRLGGLKKRHIVLLGMGLLVIFGWAEFTRVRTPESSSSVESSLRQLDEQRHQQALNRVQAAQQHNAEETEEGYAPDTDTKALPGYQLGVAPSSR
jgi:hypothetical protein